MMFGLRLTVFPSDRIHPYTCLHDPTLTYPCRCPAAQEKSFWLLFREGSARKHAHPGRERSWENRLGPARHTRPRQDQQKRPDQCCALPASAGSDAVSAIGWRIPVKQRGRTRHCFLPPYACPLSRLLGEGEWWPMARPCSPATPHCKNAPRFRGAFWQNGGR